MKEDPTLKRIVDVIVEVLDPDRIILFGSRARGDYDEESDYDLLVLKEGVRPKERRRLQWEVRRSIRSRGIWAPLDIVVQSPERYAELKDDSFMLYGFVETEGIVLYERKESNSVASIRRR